MPDPIDIEQTRKPPRSLTPLERVMEPILVGIGLVVLGGIFAWIVFLA